LIYSQLKTYVKLLNYRKSCPKRTGFSTQFSDNFYPEKNSDNFFSPIKGGFSTSVVDGVTSSLEARLRQGFELSDQAKGSSLA